MARLEEEYGLLAEFKVGIPDKDPLSFTTMTSVNKYDSIKKGWEKEPNIYDIGLFLFTKFFPRATSILQETRKEDQKFVYETDEERIEVEIGHPFTLWRFTDSHVQK